MPPFSDDSSSETSDLEPESPQKKLIRYAHREREDSGDEEDIPLKKLLSRLRGCERREKKKTKYLKTVSNPRKMHMQQVICTH